MAGGNVKFGVEKYFWELMGGTMFLKVHRGGTQKPVGIFYLNNVRLYYHRVMGWAAKCFPMFKRGLQTIFYAIQAQLHVQSFVALSHANLCNSDAIFVKCMQKYYLEKHVFHSMQLESFCFGYIVTFHFVASNTIYAIRYQVSWRKTTYKGGSVNPQLSWGHRY